MVDVLAVRTAGLLSIMEEGRGTHLLSCVEGAMLAC